MAIVSRTATKVATASAQTVTGTRPTDRQAGDYVVAVFGCTSTVGTFTAPSAGIWTQLIAPGIVATDRLLAVYGAFDPSADPTASTTTAASRQTCICQAYGGVDTGTPVDVTGTAQNSSGTTTIDALAVTIATAGAQLLAFAVADSSTGTWTEPGGMTLVHKTTGSDGGRALDVADEVRSATGSTGNRTFTLSQTVSMRAAMLALRPAVISAWTYGWEARIG